MLLHGVGQYLQVHPNWTVIAQEKNLADGIPPWLTRKTCNGVIARIENRKLLDALVLLKLPVVNLSCRYAAPGVPRILSDESAIARMVADHFISRGICHFAFCGFASAAWSARRRDQFVAHLRGRGHTVDVHETGPAVGDPITSEIETAAILMHRGLDAWVRSLPKPCGVMACNDACGLVVLGGCRREQIRVPDEVAVIGVDNNETLCELANPSLTSVQQAATRIGFEAMVMLEKMIRTRERPSTLVEFPPESVVERASTQTLLVADRHVAEAVRFIHKHACEGIDVEQVLDYLADQNMNVSRSTLERRFTEHLRRTPKEEILRVRLNRAQQLLRATRLNLDRVAQEVGIATASHLSALFKRHFNQTPGNFRNRPPANHR
jgi:LacI family transcriptional regulator